MKEWGPREIIALVVILGAFVLAGVGLFAERTSSVPAWVIALIGAIGFYLYRNGKRGGE